MSEFLIIIVFLRENKGKKVNAIGPLSINTNIETAEVNLTNSFRYLVTYHLYKHI